MANNIVNRCGRPSGFSQELADKILTRIAEGESLRAICRDDGMPDKCMVFRWLSDPDKIAFRDQYSRAREIQADAMFDEMKDISDDGSNDWMEKELRGGHTEIVLDREHVERSKVRIATRQWILARMMPKKYGERTILQGDKDADPLQSQVTHEISQSVTGIVKQIALTKATRSLEPPEMDREGET